MLKIEKKTFRSSIYNPDEIERGRLSVYGELRRYLDRNKTLRLTDMKESVIRSNLGGMITIILTVTLKNYL